MPNTTPAARIATRPGPLHTPSHALTMPNTAHAPPLHATPTRPTWLRPIAEHPPRHAPSTLAARMTPKRKKAAGGRKGRTATGIQLSGELSQPDRRREGGLRGQQRKLKQQLLLRTSRNQKKRLLLRRSGKRLLLRRSRNTNKRLLLRRSGDKQRLLSRRSRRKTQQLRSKLQTRLPQGWRHHGRRCGRRRLIAEGVDCAPSRVTTSCLTIKKNCRPPSVVVHLDPTGSANVGHRNT